MDLKREGIPLAVFFLLMATVLGAHAQQVQRNIEYAKTAGIPLYMDASIPNGPGLHPAAILVHGGGWVRGDRRTEVAPLFQPLETAGIAWFSIDYRLSNDLTQFGVAVEDVRSAIRFVKAHAADYRIDADRIALIGESAGGQLAAMAALNPAPGERVNALVALYAPMDLVDLAKNSTMVPRPIRDALHGSPFESLILARLAQLSPIENAKRDAPSFLLIHGTADNLVPFSQSVAMCDRMKRAGASCELYPVPGGGHGIRWWESSRPAEALAYKQKMTQWLNERLSVIQRASSWR